MPPDSEAPLGLVLGSEADGIRMAWVAYGTTRTNRSWSTRLTIQQSEFTVSAESQPVVAMDPRYVSKAQPILKRPLRIAYNADFEASLQIPSGNIVLSPPVRCKCWSTGGCSPQSWG